VAVLEILKFPDPRLRKMCQAVEEVTAELGQFAEDMLETMYEHKGIGLAAAQVNRQIRFLVADTRPKDEQGRYDNSEMTDLEKAVEQPVKIFNPVIVEKRGKTSYDEGCLSVPTYFETVERFDWIKVEGLDAEGKPMMIETDGLLSICIQHEIDHLDGKLFIDRLSPIKANRLKAKIKKLGYPDPEEESESSTEEVGV
jgi:peptide deformylase